MEGMSRRAREAEASVVHGLFRDHASGHSTLAGDALRDETLRRMLNVTHPTVASQLN
jgi:hypothetical protein